MTIFPERILVVDDEPTITEVVGSYLVQAGFEPVRAAGGAEALQLFEDMRPCLVILDLMLPDLSGEEVCRRLRARSRVPIIMLTAKIQDADAINGLSIGADDYVTKPFSPRELVARVQAVLRRTHGGAAPLARQRRFGGGDLELDTETGEVRKAGRPVRVTPRELRLLQVLASSPGRIFSREDLVADALGDDFSGRGRTIDAHVKNLRQKIETHPRQPSYLLTVHGMGYQFSPGESS